MYSDIQHHIAQFVGWAKGFLAHHRCKPSTVVLASIEVHRGGQTKGAFAHPTGLRNKKTLGGHAVIVDKLPNCNRWL
jgi:hypothetical protein